MYFLCPLCIAYVQAVQQVMNNLLVSHIELRGEESADIKPYTHERSVEKVVVPLGEELTLIQEKYMRVGLMVENVAGPVNNLWVGANIGVPGYKTWALTAPRQWSK